MKPRYVVLAAADQDLDDEAWYLATEGSPEVGIRFLAASHASFALLATQPHMGRLYHSRHPDLDGLRLFRVREFEKLLIFYRPHEWGVEIVRVIHGARDLDALFDAGTEG